jgi:hypothetical protein
VNIETTKITNYNHNNNNNNNNNNNTIRKVSKLNITIVETEANTS